jgi:hypothetical protein
VPAPVAEINWRLEVVKGIGKGIYMHKMDCNAKVRTVPRHM